MVPAPDTVETSTPERPGAAGARAAIEVRNLRFPIEDGVPKYWHGGRRSLSLYFNSLSIFFPEGERFFVRSIKRYKGEIHDEALLRDVTAFCAQEGVHGREHTRYNELLRTQGYPVEALERGVDRILGLVRRALPRRWQLGVTAALEHFTAAMGHHLLTVPRLLEGAHPEMAALWRWHSAEEIEHKHVAYDVFMAVGGTYPERAAMMAGAARLIFWAKVLQHLIRFMHADGILFSWREWRDLVHFLFVNPGGMLGLVGDMLDYFRPGFHPLDRDDSALLTSWRSGAALLSQE